VVALQNYKKLKHTFFDEYKTNIPKFKEAIWQEPGVIDLLYFMIPLDESPLPDKDNYKDLLRKNYTDYYNKKWNEIYDNLKDRIGRKTHENYAKICEMKVDNHIITDTEMMYFLLEKLKNNKPLPPDSGHETKRLVDCATIEEGSLEELVRKYGIDFTFIDTDELEEIGRKFGIIAQLDYMIKYHQDGVKAYKGQEDQYKFEKEQLEKAKRIKKEFMEKYQKDDKGKKKLTKKDSPDEYDEVGELTGDGL
jgi:hypothetical protein